MSGPTACRVENPYLPLEQCVGYGWGHSEKEGTVMRRLTTEIRSEKCLVRRFRRCANVIECTYTNLDSIAYYTPRLYGIAYCS